MNLKIEPAKFRLGDVVMTPSIEALFTEEQVSSILNRHGSCDWGTVSPGDKKYNDDSLTLADRVHSNYVIPDKKGVDTTVWIITEGDRSATTILLPDEY